MPEHIRALFVITSLATVFFVFARKPACTVIETDEYVRRRNLWFGLLLSLFVAHNFWIYLLIAIPMIVYTNRRETNPAALFFFLLFVLPMNYVQIPGFGLINYLFDLSNYRILALFILFPTFVSLVEKSTSTSFGSTGPDKALAAYLFISAILYLREGTVTDTLRYSFYLFIDVFLPYFVVSRSINNLQDFRDAVLSIALAIMVMAPLAIFEFVKHWLLFSAIVNASDFQGGLTGYLGRDGMLRAIVTTGQPIVLGYVMVVGMGMYLFLQFSIQKSFMRLFGMALLAAGLLVSLSRGPWVGGLILMFVFISTGRHAVRRLASLALAALIVIPLISLIPGGNKVINLLPFIGTTESENVTYREELITNSMIVINRNLWFGSVNYLNTPEMESMRQGEGIIDIVNTFIGIALEKGLIGLGIFVSFFVLTLLGIYKGMRLIPDIGSEEFLLGRALMATLIAILVIIFTVSSIAFVPIVYWCVAALGVAYAQMMQKNNA